MDARVTVGNKTIHISDATTAEILALVRAALDNPSVTQIRIERES